MPPSPSSRASFLLPPAIAAAALLMYVGLVSTLQEKLIYMPRAYQDHPVHYSRSRDKALRKLRRSLGGGIEELTYSLPMPSSSSSSSSDPSPLRQTAYFLYPGHLRPGRSGDLVAEFDLWLAAGGNAGLALDWLDVAAEFMARKRPQRSPPPSPSPPRPAAFLLVDYPGYGENDGEPSPTTMLGGNVAALRALDAHLSSSKRRSRPPRYTINYVAHSIGCSVALAHAADVVTDLVERHGGGGSGDDDDETSSEVARMVLVSPFTTMVEMAERTLPIPVPGLERLLRHPFDNPREIERMGKALKKRGGTRTSTTKRKRKRESKTKQAIPALHMTVIHGDADNIVPVEMGRRIAAIGTRMEEEIGPHAFQAVYHEVRRGDHNGILHGDANRERILRAMGAGRGGGGGVA